MFDRCQRRVPDGQLDADDWEQQFRHWLYRQPEAYAMVTAKAYHQQTGSFQGWPQQLRRNVTLYQQARERYATTIAGDPTRCHT